MTTFSRRKALALAGAVALASGLAAATPALAQDCEKVDLTFTFWGSVNEKNDIENAVKNWNTNNPCIQVKPMHIPATGTNYVQKLTTMIASNTAPDIGYLGENQAFQWATEGKILDLSPYMGETPDQQYIKSTIYKAGDTLMGTGLATGVMLIYYNTDVFDAGQGRRGLDLAAVCRQRQAPDQGSLGQERHRPGLRPQRHRHVRRDTALMVGWLVSLRDVQWRPVCQRGRHRPHPQLARGG